MKAATQRLDDSDARLVHLSAAIVVEREVRGKRQLSDLCHYLVNESARVHAHELGFVFLPKGRTGQIAAASNVAKLDQDGPLAVELNQQVQNEWGRGADTKVRIVESPPPRTAWSSGKLKELPPHLMWVPLPDPDGGLAGLLLLLRDQPWRERDRLLAEPLAECYGHAIAALRDRPWLGRRWPFRRRMVFLAWLAGLVLVGSLPVPLTALAPAEVVASDPVPISAPFDGIVAEVLVRPFETVSKGQLVAKLDATELTMEHAVVAKALEVDRAELNLLRNQAYLQADSKVQVAIWKKKVELSAQKVVNAKEKLDRHRLLAPGDGIVMYDDRFDWRGRPVAAGELLMTFARPENREIRIEIPVANLVPLENGSAVEIFFDMDPTKPVAARLDRKGYQARPTPSGTLAYNYTAVLDSFDEAVLLGARGTARLEGETVSLAYYLLRRPWAAIRQFMGL